MNTPDKLLILTRNSKRYAELLTDRRIQHLDIFAYDVPDDVGKEIEACNIILGEPDRVAQVFDSVSQLQWVQSTFAGVEPLLEPNRRNDYLLTNVKDIFGPMMSEYVFGYVIALERHIFKIAKNQRKKRWKGLRYRTLNKVTLGVCGVGSIGRHIAATAKHFGMTVWGYRKSGKPVAQVDRMFTKPDLLEFLSVPDYIVITLPHTPETEHIFDQAAFDAMKNSAVLINVGRGRVVSESSLIQALNAGKVRGAVLDVFEQEPLTSDNPLWDMDNVWITPHISAYSFAEDIVTIFMENYKRFKSGKPLLYTVDFNKGY
jgi:phosphoglycerate dehydrogenase-like enzyme